MEIRFRLRKTSDWKHSDVLFDHRMVLDVPLLLLRYKWFNIILMVLFTYYWDQDKLYDNQRDSSLKNRNVVIIYSSSCYSKPVWVSLFCWTQKKIFWRMLLIAIDLYIILYYIILFYLYYLYIIFSPTMEVIGYQQQVFAYQTFFKLSLFSARKKLIQVWNNLRQSKLWQFDFFGELSL